MVARHGAATLCRRCHHPTDVEALAVAVVGCIIEHALDEKVAVLEELAHFCLRITLRQNHDIDGLGDVFVTNPGLVDGQVEVIVVADEIVVGADREAHPFLELAFPSLVTQGNVNLHLGERHDDRLLEGLGDFESLVGGLPFAVEVLVALGKQQMIGSRLIHLDDVGAKLQIIDKVGLGAAPIRLMDEFLQGEGGFIMVSSETIVDAQR